MRITEVLGMDEYFHDRRYQCKKPKLDGEPYDQCGRRLQNELRSRQSDH